MKSNLVIIEDTKFIFNTNFSGDPKRDRFGSQQRRGNIVIPDIDLARQLIDEGYNVKMTRPRDGEEEGFVPRYFIAVKVNYDSKMPPKVFLITEEDRAVLLNSETIGNIDDMWIEKVNVVLNRYKGLNGKSLYVKSMEVFQKVDEDPISMRHSMRNNPVCDSDEDDALPFN